MPTISDCQSCRRIVQLQKRKGEIKMNKRLIISMTFLMVSLLLGSEISLAGGAPLPSDATPDVYKLVAENNQWRVFRATWKPGQEDNFHSHSADRVSLFDMDCDLRLTKPSGEFKDVHPKAGKAKVRTGKPMNSHKAKNIGGKDCSLWIVELK
jgi:hypothetical protein